MRYDIPGRAFAGILCVLLAAAGTVLAQDLPPRDPLTCAHPGRFADPDPDAAAYEWQGPSQAMQIPVVSSESQACLHATLFAPVQAEIDHAAAAGERFPAIVIVPPTAGRVGTLDSSWAARALAPEGYVVLSIDPQAQGLSEPLGFPPCNASGVCPGMNVGVSNVHNYAVAITSAIDFLGSDRNPFREVTDLDRVGAAGWSQGGQGVSLGQQEDPRVDAIVGWDSIASTETGDAGSPRCPGELTANPITPRAPAMGHSSDRVCDYGDEDLKKTAWNVWKSHGVPAVQIVFKGRDHSAWGDRSEPIWHRHQAYYTQAWFDLWLKDDLTGIDRILAERIFEGTEGEASLHGDILSVNFRSGVYLPASWLPSGASTETILCEDMSDCGPGGGDPGPTPTPDPDPTPTPVPDGPTCNGLAATFVGTEGDDVIDIDQGRDVVVALGGNDVIRTAGGDDVICAGPGNDVVYGGAGNDLIFGEEGNDVLLGGSGAGDEAFGGEGVDICDTETSDCEASS